VYASGDNNVNHYIRGYVMEPIFGAGNFRNEIVWCYGGGGRGVKDFPQRHDNIYRYSKGSDVIFNPNDVLIPYNEKTKLVSNYTRKGCTKPWTANPDGKVPEDWWIIPIIHPSGKERIGYPTQKPEALLERIIRASSNEGEQGK